jgi:dTDP-4-dehydrorhamnose reductase
MRSKIIATGLSGLVGSRIVQVLKDKYEFISFSLDKGIDILNYDLLKSKFQELADAKAVIHLAAFTDVNEAWKQRGDREGLCYKINVEGTRNVSTLAGEFKKYLIHISTDFVFNGKNPPTGGYTESDEPKPIEWYGWTKLLAEQEIQNLSIEASILRIAFPYKAKPADKKLEPVVKRDLIRKLKKQLENKKQLSLFSDQIITPTFIDDIAKAIDMVLEKRPTGVYHCVGSDSLSPYDLGLKIADTFSLDKSLVSKDFLDEYYKDNLDSRPRQRNLTVSNQKLKTKLGIKMCTVDQGLNQVCSQLSA